MYFVIKSSEEFYCGNISESRRCHVYACESCLQAELVGAECGYAFDGLRATGPFCEICDNLHLKIYDN